MRPSTRTKFGAGLVPYQNKVFGSGCFAFKKKNLDWGGFTNNGIDTRNVEGD